MTFISPGAFHKDSDGFAPPKFGGALAIKHGTVEHTDTTAKTLFTLPKGAVVVDILIEVLTGFDGTASTLDVGKDATGDFYVDGADIADPAVLRYGATGFDPATLLNTPFAADTAITATHISGGGSPAAGEATITFTYYLTDALPA